MTEAIQLIVNGYVKLSARKALEDLKAHRHRLASELKSLNGPLDLGSSIKQLEDEITVIDAGLARLNSAAAA
jgi:prefoldin subunit 5